MIPRVVLVTIAAYLAGSFCAAYYLVYWRTGQDVRAVGSGNAGARNAGRVLGKRGFITVFLIDMAKGTLAMWLAHWSELSGWALVVPFLAVVLGHLYPVQLGFRGGKGASTAFGALLYIDTTLAFVTLGVAAVVYLITRAFTVSGLIAIALAPVAAFILLSTVSTTASVALVALLLVFSHRENFRQLVHHPSQ